MKLNKREYAILVFGLILVGVLSYYLFVISPSLENEKTYQRYIANKERDLQEMLLLKAKWEEFSKRKKRRRRLSGGGGRISRCSPFSKAWRRRRESARISNT